MLVKHFKPYANWQISLKCHIILVIMFLLNLQLSNKILNFFLDGLLMENMLVITLVIHMLWDPQVKSLLAPTKS